MLFLSFLFFFIDKLHAPCGTWRYLKLILPIKKKKKNQMANDQVITIMGRTI
jgi:hypothetical protein